MLAPPRDVVVGHRPVAARVEVDEPAEVLDRPAAPDDEEAVLADVAELVLVDLDEREVLADVRGPDLEAAVGEAMDADAARGPDRHERAAHLVGGHVADEALDVVDVGDLVADGVRAAEPAALPLAKGVAERRAPGVARAGRGPDVARAA